MTLKKFIVGLMVLATVSLYPLVSSGKSNKTNKIILDKNNLVVLNSEINDQTVAETIQKLRKLDSSHWNRNKPIYLFLYTPGGSIQAGLELIEAINGLHRKVDTVTLFAASMGFQLAQNLNERLILANGVLMSHRAAGAFEGYFGGKSPSQLDSRYALWLQRVQELDQKTVERTKGKQTMESYREQYRDEMWLTGVQSVAQGYADEVVNVGCDSSLDGTDSHQVDFLGTIIQFETSKCPMITGLLNIKIVGADGKSVSPINVDEIKQKFVDQHDLEKNFK